MGDTIGDSIVRRPFWLDALGLPASAWIHYPETGPVRPRGVVICPPLGFEYIHAHRTLLHLADELAKAGFVALRLDYPGTGDSAGDESTLALVSHWAASISAGVEALAEITSKSPNLVGVRAGASLASQSLANRSWGIRLLGTDSAVNVSSENFKPWPR